MNKIVTSIFLATLAAVAIPASGDVFRLTNGRTIEGQLLETIEGRHRIRTPSGKIELVPVSQVIERSKSPPPLERYESAKSNYPDTPAGHVALARWCAANGLPEKWTEHLHQALAKDPEYQPALRELGWIRIGDAWLKTGRGQPATPEELARQAEEKRREEAELLRNAIAAWFVKVRAVYAAHLVTGGHVASPDSLKAGLEKLRGIRQPLAIPALAEVLARKHAITRRMLVDVLGGFKQDEAVLNLMALALLDPDEKVRKMADSVLAKRNDPRITEQFVEALTSREEQVILNAAEALATLQKMETVPALVKVLKSNGENSRGRSREALINGLMKRFATPRRESVENRTISYAPRIRVLGRNSPVGLLKTANARSTYRSAVQEALIDITGVNHGFDEQAWNLWYLQNVESKKDQN